MLTLPVSERASSTGSLSFKDGNYMKSGNGKVTEDEDNLHISEKIFILPNKDLYSGFLIDNVPVGFGKYIWSSDGVKYEGQWKCGVRSGYGKLQWPSGAIYEGDFLGGYMHGTGIYTCSDMTYKGRWRLNLKHGLGYQVYSNGDVLEGAWMQGTPEGPCKYTWSNKNMYLGNIKSGKMTGKGTLIWTNGESFEGGWLDGMMHGFGVYTWSDGSCYIGIWTKGLKDGKGTFYPNGDTLRKGQNLYINSLRKRGLLPDLRKPNQISHINVNWRSEQQSSNKMSKGKNMNLEPSGTTNVSLGRRHSLDVSIEKAIGYDFSLSLSEALRGTGEQDVADSPILEREYMQGVLISEVVISDRFSPSSKVEKKRKKIAKGIKRIGEIIIKGHKSYDLMLSLQLGIRYTVSKITPIKRRKVRASDFGSHASFWMNFPKQGSQLTPPHQSEDFWWKEYCPMVFRNLREMFKIDAADYMISICGNDALRELSSPGKSGSIFFLSQDDRFMIKTLRKSEVKVLLQMLPAYHHHVQKYDNTLITKFFGLHRIKPLSGRKIRFVVMGNMFCTELRIHRRFDLKGSSLGRSANKVEIDENTILKDLDLNYCFYLESTWRSALLKQIETDSKFLESLNIMDYSMLLGVHYRAPQRLRSLKSNNQRMSANRMEVVAEEESMDDEISAQGLILVPRGSDDNIVSVGPHIRGSRLRASSTTGNEEVDLLLPGTARLQIQLGVNMPARAEEIEGKDKREEGYDVVLYLGIIDILQEYNMRKKIEHAYKSIHFHSLSISSVHPTFYSRRFLHFIHKVFPPNTHTPAPLAS